MEVIRDDLEAEDGACTEDLTECTERNECEGESEPHTESIEEGQDRGVEQCEGLCTSEDDTVNNDQRDIDTERAVYIRCIGLHQKLYDGYERRNDDDLTRKTHTTRNHLTDGGNKHVGHDQYGGRGKTHADRVGRTRGGCQCRTHTKHHDEGRIFFNDTVINSFYIFIHLLSSFT